MERKIVAKLREWKNSPNRKPLILAGARQVGKTYILKEFGRKEYENVAYINCDHNEQARSLFSNGYDIKRIIMAIGAITHETIKPGKTLIVLDEIQELEHGLTALKYFCEDAPEYHVAVAGSLLGIAMRHGESAPIGKVNIIRMFPMDFEEYLMARSETNALEMLQSGDWTTVSMIHETLQKLLREYYFVGGMPEAVSTFVKSLDTNAVRRVHNDILFIYRSDMSKHVTPNEATRISMVWQSIPSQLARENKKFVYGAVKAGARAKDFEMAIQWLVDAGLIYRVSRVRAVGMPLKFYEDFNAFKLYLLDVGLLGALSEIEPAQMLLSNDSLTKCKGALTENYVLCQMKCIDELYTYYYSREDSKLEVDFVVQHNGKVTPIEVKAEENLRSKSLKTFMSSHTDLMAIRFSMSKYKEQEWMKNVPLYGIPSVF
ncbi:MAG: ATP-binding protein [Prevotellaceae bacterium]|nr:ATP-binding protein [Prevotellaceae bacterium]